MEAIIQLAGQLIGLVVGRAKHGASRADVLAIVKEVVRQNTFQLETELAIAAMATLGDHAQRVLDAFDPPHVTPNPHAELTIGERDGTEIWKAIEKDKGK